MRPTWLCSSDIDEVDKDRPIAIVIGYTGIDQSHVGIVYQDPKGTLNQLGMAFVGLIRSTLAEAFPTLYVWTYPAIKIETATFIASQCKRLCQLRDRQTLQYGLQNAPRIMRDGKVSLGNPPRGFTCSSLVLEIFRSANAPLLTENWPKRPDDQEWQKRVIRAYMQILKDAGVEESFVRLRTMQMKFEVGAARYRPQEVFIASTIPNGPHDFADIDKPATDIVVALSFSYWPILFSSTVSPSTSAGATSAATVATQG